MTRFTQLDTRLKFTLFDMYRLVGLGGGQREELISAGLFFSASPPRNVCDNIKFMKG